MHDRRDVFTRGNYRRSEYRRLWSLLVLIVSLIICAGCGRQDANIAGVEIPIPSHLTRDPDTAIKPIPGYNDGQAAYQGKISSREVYEFYQENMEARGWKPTNFMVSGKDQLAYSKAGRICLVWYTPNADGTTSVVILVGTDKTS